MARRGRKRRKNKEKHNNNFHGPTAASNQDKPVMTFYDNDADNQRKLVEKALSTALVDMQDRMPTPASKVVTTVDGTTVPAAFAPNARPGHQGPPALPYMNGGGKDKIGFDTGGSKGVVTVTVQEPPLFYYIMDIDTDKQKDITLVAFDRALLSSLKDYWSIKQDIKGFRGTWKDAEAEGFKKSEVLDVRTKCCAQDVKSVVKHAMARVYPTTKIAEGLLGQKAQVA